MVARLLLINLLMTRITNFVDPNQSEMVVLYAIFAHSPRYPAAAFLLARTARGCCEAMRLGGFPPPAWQSC